MILKNNPKRDVINAVWRPEIRFGTLWSKFSGLVSKEINDIVTPKNVPKIPVINTNEALFLEGKDFLEKKYIIKLQQKIITINLLIVCFRIRE